MVIDRVIEDLKPLLNNDKKELFNRLVSLRLVKSLENYAKDLVKELESSEILLSSEAGTKKLLYKINKGDRT